MKIWQNHQIWWYCSVTFHSEGIRLTIGLRFSTRWIPTIPRKAPKLSWMSREQEQKQSAFRLRGTLMGDNLRRGRCERVCDADWDSLWFRGNILPRGRCLCAWQRSDPQSAPAAPEPAGTRSSTGPTSSGAGTELQLTREVQMHNQLRAQTFSPPLLNDDKTKFQTASTRRRKQGWFYSRHWCRIPESE